MTIERDNKKNRIAGTTLSMINMIFSVAVGVIYTPFVLHSLGNSEYGVYTLANSIISFLAILDLGLGNALVRYTARARADGKDEKDINGAFLKLYSLIAIVALIVGLFISANLEVFFSSSFSIEEIQILRRVFYVLLINTVFAFPACVFSSLITSHEHFKFSGILTLVSNVLVHVANFAFLYLGYKSLTIALVSLCANCVTWCVNIIFCKVKINIKIGFNKLGKGFYKDLFRYSFFILLNIIIDKLYSSTDNIILGVLCGSVPVAIYGIGVTFQSYFQQVSTAIASVYFPLISKLSVREDGMKSMSELFTKIGRIQMLILLYLLSGFFVFGQDFIALWAGDGYGDSYAIALIIMIPSVVPLSQNIGISILRAINKHSVRSIMFLCIAILNVLISIPLTCLYGGIGAAIGTSVGNLLGQILFMNYYYNKLGLDISKYWKCFGSILLKMIPIIVVFFCARLIPISGWLGLILKICFSQLFALPYCYFTFLNAAEKGNITKIVGKVFRK